MRPDDSENLHVGPTIPQGELTVLDINVVQHTLISNVALQNQA